jgi:hypothetical protein
LNEPQIERGLLNELRIERGLLNEPQIERGLLNEPRIERGLLKYRLAVSGLASFAYRAMNLRLRDPFQLTVVVVMSQASWLAEICGLWCPISRVKGTETTDTNCQKHKKFGAR